MDSSYDRKPQGMVNLLRCFAAGLVLAALCLDALIVLKDSVLPIIAQGRWYTSEPMAVFLNSLTLAFRIIPLLLAVGALLAVIRLSTTGLWVMHWVERYYSWVAVLQTCLLVLASVFVIYVAFRNRMPMESTLMLMLMLALLLVLMVVMVKYHRHAARVLDDVAVNLETGEQSKGAYSCSLTALGVTLGIVYLLQALALLLMDSPLREVENSLSDLLYMLPRENRRTLQNAIDLLAPGGFGMSWFSPALHAVMCFGTARLYRRYTEAVYEAEPSKLLENDSKLLG